MIDGLEYMWNLGIKHRDIKPENFLFDENYRIKFADFGFSSTETKTTTRNGTSSYLAPEAFLQDEFDTESLDIFALGIVLFTMFAR